MHRSILSVALGCALITGAASALVPAPASSIPRARAAATSDRSSANPINEDVELALKTLSTHVARLSHDDALRSAFAAYYRYRAAHPERVRKPLLYFVDFGLDSRTPRGYVFDMESLTVVEGPFMVAHGRGSLNARDGVPTRFSNRPGSYATSLGLYVAQETYTFSGKAGGQRYTSVGLRLDGVSDRFNSAARQRGIVAHGAPYVTAQRAGRSEGCPAMESARARRLLPKIANGGLVFLFSGNDAQWLRQDPWGGNIAADADPVPTR